MIAGLAAPCSATTVLKHSGGAITGSSGGSTAIPIGTAFTGTLTFDDTVRIAAAEARRTAISDLTEGRRRDSLRVHDSAIFWSNTYTVTGSGQAGLQLD